MTYTIKGYDCLPIRIFEEISAIPRASGNEAGIADYIERFAKARGLACYRDTANNVFVEKAASAGREGEDPVLLQAHTDMVAEKNKGVSHCFERDPIRLVQEGNVLRADGTTLGADDGFGVAILLAALEKAEDHPPLCCLFTTSEEVGMEGAMAFDFSRVRAHRMLNLDSDAEHEIIVGCCGGQRSDMYLSLSREDIKGEGIAVTVSGLCGGHSGADIHKGRGNALMLMHRLLTRAAEVTAVCLSQIAGGDKDNAIPRECEAVLACGDPVAAMNALRAAADELKASCEAPEDAGLTVTLSPVTYHGRFDAKDTEKILCLLGTEGGVLTWRERGVMPETSRNIASIAVKGTNVRVTVSTRSADRTALRESNAALEARVASVGGEITHRGGYPGWESATDSALVRAWQSAYRGVTGREALATVIHAGLECGLICDAVAGLEAISVGCNIRDLHTPEERMELDSFERIWQTVLEFLKQA